MIKQAIYKNPIECIQFDGTNQEAIKEFTGSSYLNTVKYMDKDELTAIQFQLNEQRQQISEGMWIVKIDGIYLGIFDNYRFESIYKIID